MPGTLEGHIHTHSAGVLLDRFVEAYLAYVDHGCRADTERRVQEDAKRKAEEQGRKSDDDAKRKIDEEARRKVEEESRRERSLKFKWFVPERGVKRPV